MNKYYDSTFCFNCHHLATDEIYGFGFCCNCYNSILNRYNTYQNNKFADLVSRMASKYEQALQEQREEFEDTINQLGFLLKDLSKEIEKSKK